HFLAGAVASAVGPHVDVRARDAVSGAPVPDRAGRLGGLGAPAVDDHADPGHRHLRLPRIRPSGRPPGRPVPSRSVGRRVRCGPGAPGRSPPAILVRRRRGPGAPRRPGRSVTRGPPARRTARYRRRGTGPSGAGAAGQPWRALKRGSLLLITNVTPRWRTTWAPGRDFSARRDFRTFIVASLRERSGAPAPPPARAAGQGRGRGRGPGSAFLAEQDVPARDRVVLPQDQPVGVVQPVLPGHVGDPRTGRRPQLDDRACRAACHGVLLPPPPEPLTRTCRAWWATASGDAVFR